MKTMPGTYAKNVKRVMWTEGKFPLQAAIFEFDWDREVGIVACPNHATLQHLTEGTIIVHEGQYACVLEYAFDDANYPLKNNPLDKGTGENLIFILSADEVSALRSAGQLVMKFEYGSNEISERIRAIADVAEVV